MAQSKAFKERVERLKKIKADGHTCLDCDHRDDDGDCAFESNGGWRAKATKGPCIDWAPKKETSDYTKGYTCECGLLNRYPFYVFAHWEDLLTHTCECGREYEIRHGHAKLMEK